MQASDDSALAAAFSDALMSGFQGPAAQEVVNNFLQHTENFKRM
jgi:hypothetical protein